MIGWGPWLEAAREYLGAQEVTTVTDAVAFIEKVKDWCREGVIDSYGVTWWAGDRLPQVYVTPMSTSAIRQSMRLQVL